MPSIELYLHKMISTNVPIEIIQWWLKSINGWVLQGNWIF